MKYYDMNINVQLKSLFISEYFRVFIDRSVCLSCMLNVELPLQHYTSMTCNHLMNMNLHDKNANNLRGITVYGWN